MIKYGIITHRGTAITEDNVEYRLPVRGTDDEGYPEVLIEAKVVGGSSSMSRQSIKPLIGMKCKFYVINEPYGYNFEILE